MTNKGMFIYSHPLKIPLSFVLLLSINTYTMVQELIDKLAEVEGRKIYLQDRLRISLDEAKKAMDMINEIDADIFHMRQDIELQIINN